MPSITSLINSLLRIIPGEEATAIHKYVTRLHPQAQNLADPEISQSTFLQHLQAWHTRHAYESCRGWKWPYWLTAQSSTLSPTWLDITNSPSLTNRTHRDAVALPGLHGTFAGTMDRRGMVTPSHSRFSLETWFRIGTTVFHPQSLFNDHHIRYETTAESAIIHFDLPEFNATISARAHQNIDTPTIEISASCKSSSNPLPITIYFAIRPYTLESVIPLPDLVYNSSGFWMTESRIVSWTPTRPTHAWASDARHDDAAMFLDHPPERTAVRCQAGLATAIMAFTFPPDQEAGARIYLPLQPIVARAFHPAEFSRISRARLDTPSPSSTSWPESALTIGKSQLANLADISSPPARTYWLHNIYGLAATTHSLISHGDIKAAESLLSYSIMTRQKNGYLEISGGRWSIAGQALVSLEALEAAKPTSRFDYSTIRSIARWIMRKRREVTHSPGKPKGLLPPGVTRSGVGTEYNLADNLWCLEGLCAAANIARQRAEHHDADTFRKDAEIYAARISAAVHRELEFGFGQLAPGRLLRAFDATSAAELLDLSLMPNARRLLKSDDWFTRLINFLATPIPGAAPQSSGILLRNIDETGIRPAHRILLALALTQQSQPAAPEIAAELSHLITPMGTWTSVLHPQSASGCGQAIIDAEATALFQLLHNWQKHGRIINNPTE